MKTNRLSMKLAGIDETFRCKSDLSADFLHRANFAAFNIVVSKGRSIKCKKKKNARAGRVARAEMIVFGH